MASYFRRGISLHELCGCGGGRRPFVRACLFGQEVERQRLRRLLAGAAVDSGRQTLLHEAVPVEAAVAPALVSEWAE